MKKYTVTYLKKDDNYLMLYRNKKENDINKGKWIGVGGHIEKGETPEDSAIREIYEETGYKVKKLEFRGIILFVYNGNREYIYVYTSNEFEGTLKECDEGDLKYINEKEILSLNLWEGDKYFLKHILENDSNIFFYDMEYENDNLISVEKLI